MSIFSKKPKLTPHNDPNSFGNIAVELAYVDQKTLKKALELQEGRQPLGAVLISMGSLTPLQRDEIVFEQRRRQAKDATSRSKIDLERQVTGFGHLQDKLQKALTRSTEFNARLALKKG